MSRISRIGTAVKHKTARVAAGRRRPSVRVERLEDRTNPSVTSVFELDANATTATTHDWDQVFADNNVVPPPASGAVASAFVTDAVNSRTDDIFTGGGSKDTQGIQQGPWLFTDAKPQAKDDITHAYAAMYTDPSNGHVILYSGLDRYDNSGDATAGFWFFQNPVGLSTSTPTSSGSPFVGTHTDGDILLVSDFTQVGSVSTVKVFRWTGSDATGTLVPVTTPTGTTFAVVNSGPVTVPWAFKDKSNRTSPAAGEFLEEGVDLTALGLGSCFANFLAETRSSQSPTATLSDFVIGSFNTCRLDLPNTAQVSADGIAPITSNQVVITLTDSHNVGVPGPRMAETSGPLLLQLPQPHKKHRPAPGAHHRPAPVSRMSAPRLTVSAPPPVAGLPDLTGIDPTGLR